MRTTDAVFYIGVTMAGIGAALELSIPAAISIVGLILTATSVVAELARGREDAK